MTIVDRVYWDIAKVWCYNPDTFEFTMELDCDPHPAYPGQYLKPDYCLLISPPPLGQYETCIAENNAWRIVADYRHIPLYDKITKEVTITTILGIDCPSNLTPIKPFSNESYVVWETDRWIVSAVLLLEHNKQLKKDELRNYFHARFEKPFHSNSLNADVQNRRSGTNNDMQNYQQLYDYMVANNIETTYIRLVDNGFTGPITQAQLKTLILELTEFSLYKYSAKWHVEDMIDSCINQDELDSITVDNVF